MILGIFGDGNIMSSGIFLNDTAAELEGSTEGTIGASPSFLNTTAPKRDGRILVSTSTGSMDNLSATKRTHIGSIAAICRITFTTFNTARFKTTSQGRDSCSPSCNISYGSGLKTIFVFGGAFLFCSAIDWDCFTTTIIQAMISVRNPTIERCVFLCTVK